MLRQVETYHVQSDMFIKTNQKQLIYSIDTKINVIQIMAWTITATAWS